MPGNGGSSVEDSLCSALFVDRLFAFLFLLLFCVLFYVGILHELLARIDALGQQEFESNLHFDSFAIEIEMRSKREFLYQTSCPCFVQPAGTC